MARSLLVKTSALAGCIVMLWLPLTRVTSLVAERSDRHRTVEEELARQWGGRQLLSGPVLSAPSGLEACQGPGGSVLGLTSYRPSCQRLLLPERVSWSGVVEPQKRYRGIYEVAVYEARLRAEGFFRLPPEGRSGEAIVGLGLSDLQGIRERIRFTMGGEVLDLQPGNLGSADLPCGLHARLDPSRLGEEVAFTLEISVQGSGRLDFVPVGRETTVHLSSPWDDPSFGGAFLPRHREIGPAGFEADWYVLDLSRDLTHSWLGGTLEASFDERAEPTAFGLELMIPTDGYAKIDRATKYGLLFVTLTFVILALLELLGGHRLHPMHYLMVGCGVTLFYLLLLALYEHLGFSAAYLVATSAIVGLVATYSRSLVGSWTGSLGVAASIAALYGGLFLLLRAEQYTLLLGSLALFAVLAVAMFATRRIDWWSVGGQAAVGEETR